MLAARKAARSLTSRPIALRLSTLALAASTPLRAPHDPMPRAAATVQAIQLGGRRRAQPYVQMVCVPLALLGMF